METPEQTQQRANIFCSVPTEAPTMPFGRYKGYAITKHSEKSLLIFYHQGSFNDYPECKKWVEENLIK